MTPFDRYSAARDERVHAAAELQRRERAISTLRLAIVAVALIAVWLAFITETISAVWLLFPVVLFVVLAVVHERLIAWRSRLERGAAFYELGLARLSGKWMGRGVSGAEFADDKHPYAGDLDLFGHGSLFERVCSAATKTGRSTLASWLGSAGAAGADELRARHGAIRELAERTPLREELFVVAGEVAGGADDRELTQLAADGAPIASRGMRTAVLLVAIVAVTAFLATLPSFIAKLIATTHPGLAHGFSVTARVSVLPLLAAIVLEMILARRFAVPVAQLIAIVERSERSLALLGRLLQRIESEQFTSERLRQLRSALDRQGEPASAQIERLRRLVALLDARRNQFFAPLAALMLWTTQVSFAIDAWRRESGRDVARWIATVGELEALLSLSTLAYEEPDWTFPEIVTGGPLFEATAAGHPLIPFTRRIANDVRLGAQLQLLLVSGSNMSGKSTLMRTVGTNAVLALAGAPVCARALRISPLTIGASIRINDSLQEGASRFYAEILRLRQVLDLARGPKPLLFLLDEILHGTNSHDRRIGAEAIIRGLVARGAAGIVTTHDLALARIVDDMPAGARNVHFEDHLEDGRMVFDYTMRDGVVEKSNALELMRAVGIEV
jgi:hypothetical protein